MIYYSPHRKTRRRWRGPTRLCRTTIAVQILLLLTVSLVVCGLLELSNMGSSLLSSSGQRLMDIHTDPQAGGGEERLHDQEQVKPQPKKYGHTYTTLKGYFRQDDRSTVAADFDFMGTNFGLIDRMYGSDESLPNNGRDMTQWQRFEHHISSLNHAAVEEDGEGDDEEDKRSIKRHNSLSSPRTRYILLFLGRHGNGYHNIAERYYGTVAWDCHFSALDGDPDGIMTWSDAHLSKEGRRQAREVNSFWRTQISSLEQGGQKMSLPEVYLVSPLDRAMETAEITFDGILPDDGKLEAVVMEKLREGTGIHTCDRRNNVAYIRQRFPSFKVDMDPNLTKDDEFWDADRREPESALAERLRGFFDDLMSDNALSGNKERISITSHSGAIDAMLQVLGHRQFSLGTGAVIPVFVKVDRVSLDDNEDQRSRFGKEGKRNGGSGEGGNHKEPMFDLPNPDVEHDDNDDNDKHNATPSDAPNDKSKWETIPSCPADLDLATVGQKRWGMGLKEFLEGVENGTVIMEEVAFRFKA